MKTGSQTQIHSVLPGGGRTPPPPVRSPAECQVLRWKDQKKKEIARAMENIKENDPERHARLLLKHAKADAERRRRATEKSAQSRRQRNMKVTLAERA